MQGPTLRSVSLTTLAFVVVGLAVQALSHFVVNVEHYAAVSIMRPEPVMALGVSVLVFQGILAGFAFPMVPRTLPVLHRGLLFGWFLGAFLGSYIALVEPAKYTVPSIGAWIGVESLAALVQFTGFGVLLGLIHRERPARSAA